MSFVHLLPTVNAFLNTTCAVLLVAGLWAIKGRRRDLHRKLMLAATATSVLFLVSYLYYHSQVGSVRFAREGGLRAFYLGMLTSHTILAVVNVPLVLVTLRRGLGGRFAAHRAVARRTWPIWMYVSVTGVLVYLMLYVWFPGPGAGR